MRVRICKLLVAVMFFPVFLRATSLYTPALAIMTDPPVVSREDRSQGVYRWRFQLGGATCGF